MTVLIGFRAFLVLLIVWKNDRYSFADEIDWEILEAPIQFGKPAMILCKTKLSDISLNSTTRMWHGGLHYDVLVFDGISRDYSKYIESIDGYFSTLLIKHFNETDVNVNYGCTIGFYTCKKELRLEKKLFQYLPAYNQINESLILDNENLRIIITIEKVYPEPVCFANSSSRIIPLDVHIFANGIFYTANVNQTIDDKFLNDSDNEIIVYCSVHSHEILNKNHSTEHAERGRIKENYIFGHVIIVVSVFASLIVSIAVLGTVLYISRHGKTKGKDLLKMSTSTDSDSTVTPKNRYYNHSLHIDVNYSEYCDDRDHIQLSQMKLL